MATPDDDTDTQTLPLPPTPPPGGPPADDNEVATIIQNARAQAAATPAGTDAPIDYAAIARQLMQQPALPQVDTTPVKRGFLSLLGEALAGGPETDVMSPAQRERAGLRALGDFGTSLMAGSGYYPGKPLFGGLAQGFEGASRSERGSEQQSAAYLGAQQNWQLEQQKAYLDRLKEALPYLTLDQQSRQAAAARALAGGGGAAVPGTATGAGGPANAVPAPLAPFIAKNLPEGVTPAEDQMVRTVIGEAGNQPLVGQQGVAAVIKNRMNLGKQDAQSVIFAPNQFEPWNNPATRAKLEGLDPGSQLYQDVLNKAVRPVMSGQADDPTGGATNFYSPTAQKALGRDAPSWSVGQTPSTVIGGHQFYKLPYGAPQTAAGGTQPPAPYQVSSAGNTVPAPPGGSGGPDTTPWDLPGGPAAAPAPPTPPTDTTTPAAPVAPPTPTLYPPIKAGDVTITHPGEFSDYRAKQFVPPTGEDFNPSLTPAQQAAFATKAQQLQLAQQQITQTLMPADQPKALIEIKAKQADLAAEQQNAAQAKAQAAAAATTKYNEAQQKDIQERYNKERDAYYAAAANNQTSQNKIAEINAQTDATSRGKVFDQLDTEASAAHENLNQLQLVKALSDAAGQPGILSSYPELRSWLVKTGIASPEQTSQWSAQQALEAATNKLTLAMRQGTGMSRVTNMDLQFLQHASPQSFNPQDWRNAQIAYLQTLYQRQQQFAGLVHRGVADKMSLNDAMNAADKELGPTIPQTATAFNGQPLDKIGQDRWNFDNLSPGQFYKDASGNLKIFKPGNATRP